MLITKKYIVYPIVILLISCGAEKERTIKDNIKNLDEHNYSVLNPYLNNRSVVGLGEDTHGDGELFELKKDTIEHLHKRLGFQAVLMESDFLAVENTILSFDTHSLHEAAKIGILKTWANSNEYLKFIEYLKTSSEGGDTLYFHGFDPQLTGSNSLDIHLKFCESFKNLISTEAYNNLRIAISIMNSNDISKVSLDSLENMKNIIRQNFLKLEEIQPKSQQWLKNVLGNMRILINKKQAPPVTIDNIPEVFSHPKYLEAASIRDSIMADNILYYLTHYEKVIVWAANNHLRHQSYKRIWMGDILKQSLKDKYYSILVLYYQGVWSYPNDLQKGIIPEAEEGTLCYNINNLFPGNVGFLDVKSTKLPERIIVRKNNWITNDSINIKTFADALLFVKNATGSTPFEMDEYNKR